MANLYTRLPAWLREALNLQVPEVPNLLDTALLLPVVDTWQGGWGRMLWRIGEDTVAGGSPAGFRALEPGSRDVGHLYLAIHVVQAGGAAARLFGLLYDDVVVGTVRPRILTFSPPLNAATASIVQPDGRATGTEGIPHLVVPPGMQVGIDHPATAAGETYTFRWMVGEFRAGSKPI